MMLQPVGGDASIGEALQWAACTQPDKLALVGPAGRRSFGELNARVNRLASSLLRRGFTPGTRLAIIAGNAPEYIEVYLALAKLGMVAVPINPLLTAAEIARLLAHAEASAVFLDAEAAKRLATLWTATPALSESRRIVWGAPSAVPQAFESLIAAGSPENPPVVPVLTNCYFHTYTSGTTGTPKGCVVDQAAFVNGFKRIAIAFHLQREDVHVVPAPLFHEAPAFYALLTLFIGGSVCVVPAFDAGRVIHLIEQERITSGFVVPTMLARMSSVQASERRDLISLRVILVAGAPLPAMVRDAALREFPHADLTEFYGATEVGVISCIVHNRHPHKTGSVGRPILGMSVSIVNDAGQPVGPDQVGEVLIAGPLFMREYFRNPAANAEAFRDGWFSLGDIGKLDHEGYLYLVDRKKDVINTGGEKVYPAEVEAVLAEHSAVADVAVIGVADPDWGEAVRAVVVPAADLTAEELLRFARERLAPFRQPKSIVWASEIPRTASGKILRTLLRERHASGPGALRSNVTEPD